MEEFELSKRALYHDLLQLQEDITKMTTVFFHPLQVLPTPHEIGLCDHLLKEISDRIFNNKSMFLNHYHLQ